MKFKQNILCAMLLALLIVGCNTSNMPPASTGQPATKTFPIDSTPLAKDLGQAKDTLVVALPMDVKTLNPLLPKGNYDSVLQWELFLPLVRYYSEKSRWELVLADELNWSDDKTRLIMTLKKGYTWSDGEPITAEDVKYTYDMTADPRIGSTESYFLKNMVPGWNPKVIDENTLEWRFQHAYDEHLMMLHLSAKLAPKHKLADKDPSTLAGDAFNHMPITSGPWIVSEKQANDHITLIPNPHFHGPAAMQPRLKRVIFRIITDSVTSNLELENGNVDMVFNAPVEDVERWSKTHPEIKIHPRKYTHVSFMAYGLADLDDLRTKSAQLKKDEVLDWSTLKPHSLFSDARVRRALAKGVNIKAIIDQVYKSRTTGFVFADPAVSMVTPLFEELNAEITPMAYDVEQAKQELEAAGWSDTDGDGILNKDGHAFVFSALVPSERPTLNKASLIIQSDLRKIGVDMRIEKMNMNGILVRYFSGEYDAFVLGSFMDADKMSMQHWDPQKNGWASGYVNADIRRLLEQIEHQYDAEINNSLIKKIQELYYADQPLLFLYWGHPLVAINQRLRGTNTQDLLSPLTDLHNWWVSPDEIKYN